MAELLKRFWGSFSHLDSKFVKMCWQLLIPAKVTREYFAGRQKRYPHPVQFFFVVMFFFLLLLSKEGKGLGLNMTGQKGEFTFGEKNVKDQGKEIEVDNIHFFESIQRYLLGQELRNGFDSLPADWRTPDTRRALDSVVTLVNGSWERNVILVQDALDSTGKAQPVDTIPLNFIDRQVKIATRDLVYLEPDSIIRKYGITNWGDRTLVTQGVKSLKDASSLMQHFIGSLGWTVLALIALMSLVLYALYWRRKRYYVEHFIFLMHQNSGAFLMITLLMTINRFIYPVKEIFELLLILWIAISLLIAMRFFYGQSWIKTIAKWLIYCVIYGFAFATVFILSLLAVFLLF